MNVVHLMFTVVIRAPSTSQQVLLTCQRNHYSSRQRILKISKTHQLTDFIGKLNHHQFQGDNLCFTNQTGKQKCWSKSRFLKWPRKIQLTTFNVKGLILSIINWNDYYCNFERNVGSCMVKCHLNCTITVHSSLLKRQICNLLVTLFIT